MSNSISYASYLMSSEENPYHLNHVREFQTLSTMIAREVVDEYLESKIEPMIENAVSKAINNAFSGAIQGIGIDVERVVDYTITGLSQQYHKVSKEADKFLAEALSEELRKSLSTIDVNLIIK